MGITLHYSGELLSPSLIPTITEEMQALSEESGWSFTKIEKHVFRLPGRAPLRIQGSLITVHPKAEPFNLVFDQKGVLVSFLYLLASTQEDFAEAEKVQPTRLVILNSDGQVSEVDDTDEKYHTVGLYTASTKTQFAGPGVHITLCKLLRYLEKKYFKRLSVQDEGTYWELNDLYQLSQRMEFLGSMIKKLGDYFDSRAPDLPIDDSNPEKLLADLQEFLRRSKGVE